MTAVLSTAGGVAFVGDMDRTFRAIDVKTGKVLWETRLATSVQGFPLTFSIAGRQYIAVTSGLGGGSPRMVPTRARSRGSLPFVRKCAVRVRAAGEEVAAEGPENGCWGPTPLRSWLGKHLQRCSRGAEPRA